MPEITTADLFTVQEAITKTVRYEVGQARQEFRDQLKELKDSQRAQDDRADTHARELARLDERTRKTARSIFGALSPKQKAAVWSGAIAGAGVVLDGARHLVVLMAAFVAKAGVRP
jgi:hypothetical protein